MSLFWEVFNFIDVLVVGETWPNDEETPTTEITSRNTIEALSSIVNNVTEQHSQEINTNIDVEKNIIIDCGDQPLRPFHLRKARKKYTWLGEEIPGSGCIVWGCCYDVNQTAEIKLSSVQSTILDNVTEMANEMRTELESRIQTTTTSDGPGQDIIQTSLNRAEQSLISNITNEFKTLVNTDYEGSQTIVFKAKGPLACVNECGDPPTAGKINQSINVEISTKNIVNSYVSNVYENYMSLSTSTDITASNVDITKMYTLCILSVLFWVGIFVIGAFVCVMRWVPAQLKPCGNYPKTSGAVLVFVVYWLWKIFSCFIRGGNIFSCLF